MHLTYRQMATISFRIQYVLSPFCLYQHYFETIPTKRKRFINSYDKSIKSDMCSILTTSILREVELIQYNRINFQIEKLTNTFVEG